MIPGACHEVQPCIYQHKYGGSIWCRALNKEADYPNGECAFYKAYENAYSGDYSGKLYSDALIDKIVAGEMQYLYRAQEEARQKGWE